MKAVLLARRTADRAPGGDTLQLRETAHVLERNGLTVKIAGKAEFVDITHGHRCQRVGGDGLRWPAAGEAATARF